MNPRIFTEGINLITSTFGEAPVKGTRLDRIKSICENRVDENGFIRICNHFCETFRNFPLPMDFDKAVQDWNRDFFLKNKYYFSKGPETQSEAEILCLNCYDLGIHKIKHEPCDGFSQLIRCDCETGMNSNVKMPHWKYELKSVFKREPINPAWFKPQIENFGSDSQISNGLIAKLAEWKKKIKDSEKYWSDLGYEN